MHLLLCQKRPCRQGVLAAVSHEVAPVIKPRHTRTAPSTRLCRVHPLARGERATHRFIRWSVLTCSLSENKQCGNNILLAPRFILQYATLTEGVVVSSDNFRDLYDENSGWRETIEKRLLMPTWADQGTIMFPNDPLGRNGPTLDQFLRYT